MSVSPSQWQWVLEDDEPQVGTEDELIRQLASGRLPPYALVWRQGWGEWLPAMQVEELSEAFPEAASIGTRTPRPSSIPGVPPVPISEYPRLRHLAKAAPFGWPDGFEEGEEHEIITSEVPAAALIEAARVMTQPSPPRDLGLHEALRASRVPDGPSPSRPPQSYPPQSYPPQSYPPQSYPLQSYPLQSYPPSRSLEDRIPPSGPALPLAAEFGLQGLLDEAAPRQSGAAWLRVYGLWIALAAIGLGLALTFGARHLWVPEAAAPLAEPGVETSRRALETPGAQPRTSPAALALPPVEPAPEAGCRFLHAPASIDDWAVADVRPLIVSPSSQSVVLAYAQSHKSATGGVLDVETLQLTRRFWQQEERQIYSVTPLVAGSKPVYHVERMGGNVAFGRALDTQPPLRLGMNDDGFVLGRFEQRPQRLWELPFGSKLSVPEVVSHPFGFTLATRAGRTSGKLRVGLVSSTGQALSALAELGPDGWDFGRPALASGPEQTVLAVTRRASPELLSGTRALPSETRAPQAAYPDALYLARAKNGELPVELAAFALPDGGDPELLAPVIAALPDGSFVLMWSQGAGSRRIVRAQPLSAALEPRGPVSDLTAADPALGGAIAAALHWAGDRLLAFYFLRRDEGHSLWVGSLSCGASRANAQ
jgi:hypothetical protein